MHRSKAGELMRHLIFIFAILMAQSVCFATPVMDTAVGTGTPVLATVVPDDKDPNQYYFFPNHYELAKDPATQRMAFAYFEKSEGFWGIVKGFVNTVFEPFVADQMKTKFDEILKMNKNAKFTSIVFTSSGLITPNEDFNGLISDVSCPKIGNQNGGQIYCSWKVPSDSRKAFRRAARGKVLVQVLEYDYSFIGIVGGRQQTFQHAVPVYFTNLGAGDYFFDQNMNPIKD
jgi:hypothetical protein